MSEVPSIPAGELPSDEIVALLHDERRVRIRTEVAGDEHTVVLRYDGDTYFCDTPTKLLRSAAKEDLVRCLRRMGYSADGGD
jgi:hypothetical protein